jgi:flagellar basal body-associated protein FliL
MTRPILGEMNGKKKFWIALLPIAVVAISAIAVPWTRWVTTEISRHDASIQVTEEWKKENPGFSYTASENLRLRVKDEVGKEVVVKLDRFAEKLDAMQEAMIRLEEAVRSLEREAKNKP